MSNEIVVSICVANFNGEAILDACIESILNQKVVDNFEIIIHDDASNDQSISLIKNKYPNIKLITSDINVGYCLANNRMAAVAQGKYLLFLNNDAELFPDAIETLLTAARLSLVHTIYGLPQYDSKSHEFIDCGALIDPFFNTVPNRKFGQSDVAMVAGACFWIPKSLWVELGGFPDWFESLAEDLYLCCHARLIGYQVIALPTSGFYHCVGNSFGGGRVDNARLSTTFKRRQLSERNKLFTILIIAPNIWIFTFFPLQIMLLMLEGAILTLMKRQWRIWLDIYAPIIPSIFNHRTHCARLRKIAQHRKGVSFSKWLCIMQWQPYKIQMLIKYGVPEIK